MRVSYLKRRHNVYWFQRRPPTKLHAVLGSTMISTNLHTTDLAVACRKRDLILDEWTALSRKDRGGADVYIDALKPLKGGVDLSDSIGHVNDDIINELSEIGVNTQQGAELVLSSFSQADQAAFWAYRNATQGETPPPRFQYSIREVLALLVEYKRGTVSQLHLDKYPLAVDTFLGKGEDCALAAITKGSVVRWIRGFAKSKSTKNTYLSCLGGIFEYAQDSEHIDSQLTNPFRGIKLGKKDTKSYKFIADDLLRDILAQLKVKLHPDDALIANIGRSTGMRQAEIFNSTIETHDGITCFATRETKEWGGGKNESSRNRLVPIPKRLLAETIERHPTWLNASAFSARFGKAKAKVIDCRQTTFHSLRVSFITHAQRAGYTEQNVAWLVGHEAGKGDAMTGQLYFKGYTLELMQEIIESVEPFTTTG